MKSGNIIVNGIEHHYCLINDEMLLSERPLLIFLHEGLGSIGQWKDFPKLISKNVNCAALVYDRYGHGLSEQLHEDRTIDFMHQHAKQFLPELLNLLQLEHYPRILLGHSDGGSIAIIHAGCFPQKIKAVITIAAHIFLEEISVQGIRNAVKNFEEGKLRELLLKYHENKTDNMFYAWANTWLNPAFRQWNIEEYLWKIEAPLLAIQGDNDQYGSYAQLEGIKRQVKKVQIELIPGCGHIPHLQQREKVLQLIKAFILNLIKKKF